MLLIRPYLLMLFLLYSADGLAQYEIHGVVYDKASNTSLPGANIVAYDDTGKKILKFDITDENGKYRIKIENDSIVIAVSMLGYAKKLKEINFDRDKTELDFFLENKVQDLEEISVTAFKTGIIKNGDTLFYDHKVFSNGLEETLSDVLERLPGISIEEDGSIYSKGKKIDRLLLEGDDFMSQNKNNMLHGISAGDIAGIQLIENYSDDDLTATNNSSALNIKLTESAKEKWKFNGKVGVGYSRKYHGQSDLFKINKKIKIFASVRGGNTRNKPLTINDYYELKGGIISHFRDNNSYKETIPDIFKSSGESASSEYLFPNLNFSFNPQNKISIKGYSTFYSNKNTFDEKSYLLSNEIENTRSIFKKGRQAIIFFSENIKGDYQLDKLSKVYLDIGFVSEKTSESDNQSYLNVNEIGEAEIRKEQNSIHTYGLLSYRRIVGKRGKVKGSLPFSYQDKRNLNTIKEEEALVWNELFNLSTAINFQQKYSKKEKEFNPNFQYTYEYRNLDYTFGVEYLRQKYIYDLKNSQEGVNEFTTENQSIIRNNFFSYFSWKYKFFSNFNFSGKLILFQKTTTDILTASSEFSDKQYVLPSLSLKYNFNKGINFLTFSYNKSATPVYFESLLNAPLFQNRFQVKDNLLSYNDDEISNNFQMLFVNLNILNSSHLILLLNYSKGKKAKGIDNYFFDDYQILNKIIAKESSWVGTLNYKKEFRKKKESLEFKSINQMIDAPTFLFGQSFPRNIRTSNNVFKYSRTFKKALNLYTQTNFRYQQFSFDEITNAINSDILLKIGLKWKSQKWEMSPNYSYRVFLQNDNNLSRHYLNIDINRQVNKRLKIGIEGFHLFQLGKDTRRNFLINDLNQAEITEFNYLPGSVLFYVKYR